jgi:hypothetical protein
MTLQAQLDAMSAKFSGGESPIGPDAKKAMIAFGQDLKASGQDAKALGAGDTMPDFALPSAHGGVVQLSALTANGPLALIFYRGLW